MTGEFWLCGENVIIFRATRFVDLSFHDLEVGVGLLDVLFLLCDEFAELLVGDEGFRVVRVQSGFELFMPGHEVPVGLVLQREAGLEIHVLEFVLLGRVASNGVAVGLSDCELLANLGPVIALASGLPDADVVDRGTGEIELEGEVLASAVNDGVFAEDKFVAAQVRNDFVVPVFDRHRLPLVAPTSANAFAKLGGNEPCIAIDRRVDLEVIGVDLGDAVVVSAAASYETQGCRFAGEFEVELDDRVVEGGISQEDAFGFLRIQLGRS